MEMLSFKEYINEGLLSKDRPRLPGDPPHLEVFSKVGHALGPVRNVLAASYAEGKRLGTKDPTKKKSLRDFSKKMLKGVISGRRPPKLEERVRTPAEAGNLLGKIAKRQRREGHRSGLMAGGDRINLPGFKISNEVEMVARAFTNPKFLRAGLTGKQAEVQNIPIDKIKPSQPSVFTNPSVTKKKLEKNDPNKAAVVFKRRDGTYIAADGHHYTLERKAVGDKTVRARVYESSNM
jgi:hypothetical protein